MDKVEEPSNSVIHDCQNPLESTAGTCSETYNLDINSAFTLGPRKTFTGYKELEAGNPPKECIRNQFLPHGVI
jgi:hypothetical protein